MISRGMFVVSGGGRLRAFFAMKARRRDLGGIGAAEKYSGRPARSAAARGTV